MTTYSCDKADRLVHVCDFDGTDDNVLSKVGGSSDFSLRYRYDPANRLIGVDEVVTPSPLTVRPLKQFQYARTNAGTDRRAGKLVTSKRINWVDPVAPLFGAVGSIPFTVSQSYGYEGRDGRISARQTRATFGSEHYAFLTEFEWDRQGNLDLLSYPLCLHPPASATIYPGTSTSPTSSAS